MPSYTIYGETADRGVYCDDTSWANVQTAAGALSLVAAGATSLYVGKVKSGANYQNYLQAIGFDTSVIPDTATVTDAVLSLTAAATATKSWTLQARDYNWGGALSTGDYRTSAEWGALILLATLDLSSGISLDTAYPMAQYGVNLTNAVDITGMTYMMLGASNYGGIAPTADDRVQFYSADQTGTTKDPKLEVTTEEPADFTPFVMWIG